LQSVSKGIALWHLQKFLNLRQGGCALPANHSTGSALEGDGCYEVSLHRAVVNVLSGQTLFDELNSRQKSIRKRHKINEMMKDQAFFGSVNSRDLVMICLGFLQLFAQSRRFRSSVCTPSVGA
jgi:hypothetical protein